MADKEEQGRPMMVKVNMARACTKCNGNSINIIISFPKMVIFNHVHKRIHLTNKLEYTDNKKIFEFLEF